MTKDEYTDMVLDQQQRFGEPDTVKHQEKLDDVELDDYKDSIF